MNKVETLIIDEEYRPLLTLEDGEKIKPILQQFVKSYIEHKDKMAVEEWLPQELKANLPEYSDSEISDISSEILDTLERSEEKKESLERAIKSGRSKESWFAHEAQIAISQMSTQEASKYLADLDTALQKANASLSATLLTQSGGVSQNPCLDGFIAEQYHAQTFNLNAEATGSPYRAKVLQPDGAYSKNSVDIGIYDNRNLNIKKNPYVKRYQSKYYKNADETIKAFEKGDYRGQQKLVPADQVEEIAGTIKAVDVITAPDGTSSSPLSKQDAKHLQQEAQSGQWNDLNWNEYRAKELAVGIGKQAGQAAILGAAVGVGFNVAQKIWNDEPIDGDEIVETAIESGADFGIKAAAAGALKVGVEKRVISVIPKGTPAGILANVAFVAVEDIKVFGKVATGELTPKEGLDKMQQTTVSTVAGIATGAKGAAIGAAIGTVFGPIGTAVGGFVGGTIGYMAGSKVGETIVKGVQKVRDKVVEKVKEVGHSILEGARSVWESAKTVARALNPFSLFA